MSFYVESYGGNREFKAVPAGTHLARLYRIVDMGTQKGEWNGVEKIQRKISLGWEIHGEDDSGKPLLTDDGKPMAIWKNYTLSWAEAAALRQDLQAWRGQPWSDEEARRFNLEKLLGQWCMLNVIHKPGKEDKNKVFANVAGISPVPGFLKKQGLPEGVNTLQIFQLGNPDWELFETFSNGLKTKIEASPEYQALRGSPKTLQEMANDLDEDVPF